MSGSRPDTWMPLYWGDYLRDTMHLTAEGHGAYLLLIGAYWTRGGPLPDEPALLQAIARLDAKGWARWRAALASLFTVADGVWRHKRIDAELKAAQQGYERRVQRTAAARATRLATTPVTENATEPATEDVTSPVARTQPQPQSSPLERRVEARGTRLDPAWSLPDDWGQEAEAKREQHGFPPIDLALEAEKFANYWRAKSGQNGTKLDWKATWVNWCLTADKPRTNGAADERHHPRQSATEAALAGIAAASGRARGLR